MTPSKPSYLILKILAIIYVGIPLLIFSLFTGLRQFQSIEVYGKGSVVERSIRHPFVCSQTSVIYTASYCSPKQFFAEIWNQILLAPYIIRWAFPSLMITFPFALWYSTSRFHRKK